MRREQERKMSEASWKVKFIDFYFPPSPPLYNMYRYNIEMNIFNYWWIDGAECVRACHIVGINNYEWFVKRS